jgi:hypothetical protein
MGLNLGLHLPESYCQSAAGQLLSDQGIIDAYTRFKDICADRAGWGRGGANGWKCAPAWFAMWQHWGRSLTWNTLDTTPAPGSNANAGCYPFGDPAAPADPSYVYKSYAWAATGNFPTQYLMNRLRDDGIIPQFTWMPTGKFPIKPARDDGWFFGYWINGKGSGPLMPNVFIRDGFADAYFDAWVDKYWDWQLQLADWDADHTTTWNPDGTLTRKRTKKQASVMIRLMHEMNNNPSFAYVGGNPKDPAFTGTIQGTSCVVNNASNFKAAWDHVAQRVKERLQAKKLAQPTVKAGNIYFTFCPLGSGDSATSYYSSTVFGAPIAGQPAVDYMGFDFYNKMQCINPTASMTSGCKKSDSSKGSNVRENNYTGGQTMRARVSALANDLEDVLRTGKRYIISEYGITNPSRFCPQSGDADNEQRAKWLEGYSSGAQQGFAAVDKMTSPVIRSMGYYHQDMRLTNTGEVLQGPCCNWTLGGNHENAAWKTYGNAAFKYQTRFGIP